MVNAQLLEEAKSLAPQDRWDLIEALQESLEGDSSEPSDEVADAMLARVRDWQAGLVTPIPWSEMKAGLDRDLRP